MTYIALTIISVIILLGTMYKMTKIKLTPEVSVMYKYLIVMLVSGFFLTVSLLGWMV